MAAQGQPGSFRKDLTWIEIDDFTPGIVSQSNYAYTDTVSPVPAKLGAAQINGTSDCIALPNGGLGPLPSAQITVPWPASLAAGSVNAINGAHVHGQVGQGDEIVFGIETITANVRSFLLESYISQTNTITNVVSLSGLNTSDNEQFSPLTGDMTRVNVNTPADVGPSCLALAYTQTANSGTLVEQWLYPDPTNPGAVGVYSISSPQIGWCLTHQNRIVMLTSDNYAWIGTIGGDSTAVGTNEAFNYTDPPNSAAMGTQDVVFVQEHPWGAGAWGSISAGELFIVKHQGGAYIISGDLNFPSVTYLGGVTPTRSAYSQVAQTPIGLVYASNQNGIWVWNGGSQSQKLSVNLNDDFYSLNPTIQSQQLYSFSAAAWGDWIFMTNGWVFDIVTQSFWRLSNPFGSGALPLYYGASFNGEGMWAVANFINAQNQIFLARYGINAPVGTFDWTSYPIQASRDQNIAPERIAVRAQGIGTVTVSLIGRGGTTSVSSVTPTFNSLTQPAIVDASIGGGTGSFLAQDITISLTSTGTGGNPAPIVYSVAVGYTAVSPASAS